MNQKTVLITGGTGMVGTKLARHLLDAGHSVIILTRHPAGQKRWHPRLSFAAWDVNAGTIDVVAFAQANAIVHLAGAGVVAKPWTKEYKKEIVDSRVKSGELLVHAMQTMPNKIEVVVSASAIGWYGADSDEHGAFVEDDPADNSFLGDTCKLWEEAITPVTALGKRLVICRIGIVLANEGGALPEFKKSLLFRVAGVLGTGRQIVSWIHIDDLCHIFQSAIESDALNGIYNAVAPAPVSNRELNIALARAKYGNTFIALPVPSLALKLIMGDRSIEVLKSTNVSATKLLLAGFRFKYPDIEAAVAELVGGK